MTEKTVSGSISEDNAVKKGINLRRLLLNLLWWSLIMGVVAGICAGVVYFTEKVLGIESFLGAIIAFPVMGLLLFITLALSTNDFDTSFTFSIALAVGGFGFWLILHYFGGIGIGVMITLLIILCAFALDLTEIKKDTSPTEKPAGDVGVSEVKVTQEQNGKVVADESPLLGAKFTWQTSGSQISLNAADATPLATLKEISKEAASIAFEDGTRCQVTNSTMQIVIMELSANSPILTYQRKVFGSDESIEFADGRKLGFKRHQSNLRLVVAKLAWELHDGDKVLMRFEEKAGEGEIVFAEQLTGTRENHLLCLVGIFAIKTFWANIAAARSVKVTS